MDYNSLPADDYNSVLDSSVLSAVCNSALLLSVDCQSVFPVDCNSVFDSGPLSIDGSSVLLLSVNCNSVKKKRKKNVRTVRKMDAASDPSSDAPAPKRGSGTGLSALPSAPSGTMDSGALDKILAAIGAMDCKMDRNLPSTTA